MSTSGGGKDAPKRRALKSVSPLKRTGGPDRSEPRAPGGPGPSLDEATDALLLELLANLELSRNEIARKAGVGVATVTRRAATVGRSFDRSASAPAVEARVHDVRRRRAELMGLLIEDAHRERLMRDELAAKAQDPARARASLSQSIGATVRSAVELEGAEIQRAKLEADERQAAGVDDYLRHLSGEAATG